MSEPLGSQPIKKQSFLQGTAILALGTILVKLMGFLFKTPLNNIIGRLQRAAHDLHNGSARGNEPHDLRGAGAWK